jgi:hypothetical protein
VTKLKLLDDIINEHFVPSDNQEIRSLFEKYNIFDCLSKTTEHLKVQIQRAITSDSKAPVTAIATSSSNLLVSVNTRLTEISDLQEKRKIQVTVGQIGIRLLLSIVKLFPDQAVEIFDQVKQTLQHTSSLFNYDYNDIESLMSFKEFEDLIQTLTGVKQASEIIKIEPSKEKVLLWTQRVNIGVLTSELKKRNWIKSQNEFAKLFEKPDKSLKVRWDMNYKYELAHLLLELKDGDFIRPRKGFFLIIERHIVDFDGTITPKNSLKKISSKITTDPEKYAEITKTVDEIIKPITK